MKYPVIFLAAFVFVGSLCFSAHGEVNNPYPPPAPTAATEVGPASGPMGNGPTGSEILADLILVRPLSFAGYLLGTAMSIIATPFVLSSQDGPRVYKKLLDEPFDFSVMRPLGEFGGPEY
jgi:hypothetical protein